MMNLVIFQVRHNWHVTWSIFVVFPQNRHEGAFMSLDFSVCLGLKRKQEKNLAEPYSVNAQSEVPDAWRTHKDQVLAVPAMERLAGKWMTQDTLGARKLLVTNHKRRVELIVSDSLGRLSRHDCIQQRMYLNLDEISILKTVKERERERASLRLIRSKQ